MQCFIFFPSLLVAWAFPNEVHLFPAQILGVSNQPILPTWGSFEKEDDSCGLDTGTGCSPSVIACLYCSFIKPAKQSQLVCKVFRVRIAPNICQHTRQSALPAMCLSSSDKKNNFQEECSFTVLLFSQSTELYSVDAESKTCTFFHIHYCAIWKAQGREANF